MPTRQQARKKREVEVEEKKKELIKSLPPKEPGIKKETKSAWCVPDLPIVFLSLSLALDFPLPPCLPLSFASLDRTLLCVDYEVFSRSGVSLLEITSVQYFFWGFRVSFFASFLPFADFIPTSDDDARSSRWGVWFADADEEN